VGSCDVDPRSDTRNAAGGFKPFKLVMSALSLLAGGRLLSGSPGEPLL
jgi:hypothetical protein